MKERMPEDETGATRRQAELRYRFAKGFVDVDDFVIDAACGVGYGRDILKVPGYMGVDYHDGPRVDIVADLREWKVKVPFDVWIGLETIEHLDKLDNYIEQAKKARKFIVISTPIVPTTHVNKWHVRDHDADDVRAMFVDDRWYEWGMLRQFDTAGYEYGLFAFARR